MGGRDGRFSASRSKLEQLLFNRIENSALKSFEYSSSPCWLLLTGAPHFSTLHTTTTTTTLLSKIASCLQLILPNLYSVLLCFQNKARESEGWYFGFLFFLKKNIILSERYMIPAPFKNI